MGSGFFFIFTAESVFHATENVLSHFSNINFFLKIANIFSDLFGYFNYFLYLCNEITLAEQKRGLCGIKTWKTMRNVLLFSAKEQNAFFKEHIIGKKLKILFEIFGKLKNFSYLCTIKLKNNTTL